MHERFRESLYNSRYVQTTFKIKLRTLWTFKCTQTNLFQTFGRKKMSKSLKLSVSALDRTSKSVWRPFSNFCKKTSRFSTLSSFTTLSRALEENCIDDSCQEPVLKDLQKFWQFQKRTELIKDLDIMNENWKLKIEN